MSNNSKTTVSAGIWFFSGFICSFLINKSAFWAILHGLCGPFYILYLCFGCGGGFEGVDNGIEQLFAETPAQNEK